MPADVALLEVYGKGAVRVHDSPLTRFCALSRISLLDAKSPFHFGLGVDRRVSDHRPSRERLVKIKGQVFATDSIF